MLVYINAFLLFVVGLFTTAQGTWLDGFFRFFHLGFFIDFIVSYNYVIISVLLLFYVYKLFRLKVWWVYPLIGFVIYYLLKSINFLGSPLS